MDLSNTIKKIASEIFDDIVAKRRHLHKYPELSFKEYETSLYIKKSLDELKIPWRSIVETGVIATIAGKNSSKSQKVVALRADMDALPIEEKTNFNFKSVNKGVMHACGHDMHVSSLLGVAKILKRLEETFSGSVLLIFQPGEENLPGGASKIIEEGILSDSGVNIVIGQHIVPNIESGKISFHKGNFMASMDEVRIKVIGKGGHGAEPQNVKDPVVAASNIIVTLQQIISRFSNPGTPSILSFGNIEAKGTTNIIPDSVYMEGTFRTMDESWRKIAHEKIKNIATSVAKGLDCDCSVEVKEGYPSLYNDISLTEKLQGFSAEILGEENTIKSEIWMASEDFAYYSQSFSSCFYLLGGSYKDKTEENFLHTSTLDLNEEALMTGMSVMSYITLKYLEE